ncbi:MAG: hypothetical protein V4805_06685 [Pseudomonadota bacterium]
MNPFAVNPLISILILLAAVGGWSVLRAGVQLIDLVPSRNDDMLLF